MSSRVRCRACDARDRAFWLVLTMLPKSDSRPCKPPGAALGLREGERGAMEEGLGASRNRWKGAGWARWVSSSSASFGDDEENGRRD